MERFNEFATLEFFLNHSGDWLNSDESQNLMECLAILVFFFFRWGFSFFMEAQIIIYYHLYVCTMYILYYPLETTLKN